MSEQLSVSRDQLSKVFEDYSVVKQFEKLFERANSIGEANVMVNITSWSSFTDSINSIDSGSRVLFTGNIYKNLTGSYTDDSPSIDTTNWELV